MFNKKEGMWLIIIIIIFEFILAIRIKGDTLILDLSNPLKFLVPIIIIFVNLIAKKIAASFYSIKIEYSIWKFQRYGYYERSLLKKSFPIGLVLPFFLAFFSLGIIKPLTFLQFDAENIPEKRILKKHGIIRKSEINESDLALTAAWGFYSLLIVSLIGIIISFRELTLYPLYYGFWNLVPVENLDGIKLFFGSRISWFFVIILYIIMLVLAVMLA